MLPFTTQQLMGGQAYSRGVKIGNWTEEHQTNEELSRDYEQRKQNKSLFFLKKEAEIQHVSQPVPLSSSPDGYIRYGDFVMLSFGGESNPHVVSNNISTVIHPGATRVTASSNGTPQSRNVFRIERPILSASKSRDDIIRYGDLVSLSSHPNLFSTNGIVRDSYYLRSEIASNLVGTARKGIQEVYLASQNDRDSEWVVCPADGDMLLHTGEEVSLHSGLGLLHRMSNAYLIALEREPFPTEFGPEWIVAARTQRRIAHAHAASMGSTPFVPVPEESLLRFIYSRSADNTPAPASAAVPVTAPVLLGLIREALRALGPHAGRSVSLALHSISTDGEVPLDHFRLVLLKHEVRLSPADMDVLRGELAARGELRRGDAASAGALRALLRGAPLAAREQEAVSLAWASLSARYASVRARALERAQQQQQQQLQLQQQRERESPFGIRLSQSQISRIAQLDTQPDDGSIPLSALVSLYDPKFDFRASCREHSLESSREEFRRQFVRLEPGAAARVQAARALPAPVGSVDLALFCEYAEDLLIVLRRPEEFISFMCNAFHVEKEGFPSDWAISRGTRIWVSIDGGSASTEVVIPENEKIPEDDFRAMVLLLERYGVRSVTRFKVLGTVDL